MGTPVGLPPNLIHYPTLSAECYDTEARSLKKINDVLVRTLALLTEQEADVDTILTKLDAIIQDIGDLSTLISDKFAILTDAVQQKDLLRVTSGAFVSNFVVFAGATNLFQIDCFSICPERRWVFVFDGTDTSTFPVYIGTINPYHPTSFYTQAPFQNGVTVGMSQGSASYVEEPVNQLLVTATRRG